MYRPLAIVWILVLTATCALAAPWQGGGPDLGWVTTFERPFGPAGPLYAGTYGGGVWRSEDGGASWSEASTNARDAVVWDLTFGIDVRNSLYASTEDRGVLRSESFSSQWIEANTGLNTPLLPSVFEVEIFPLDPNRIAAATGSGARASRTRGDVWADTLRVGGVQPVRAIEILPELPRTVHYVGSAELGIQRGSEGVVEVYTQGIPNDAFFFDFASWPGDVDRFVVADFDGRVWDFDGVGFTSLGAELGFDPAPRFYGVDVTDGGGGPVIRVAADRGLFVSDDAGQTWTREARGRSAVNAEIWSILVDDPAQGSLLLGGFVDGVLRAPAGALTWTPANTGLRAAWVRAVDARDGMILAGTAHGRLFRSDDGAQTWVEVTGSLDDLQLTTVWIGDGSPWVVSAAGGVFFTEDEGATWTPATLPGAASRLIDVVEASAGRLLATSNDGLIESTDEGRTWTHVPGLDERRSGFALTARDGSVAVGFDPRPQADGLVYVDDGFGTFTALPLDDGIRPRGLAFVDGEAALLVARLPVAGGNLVRVEGFGADRLTVAEEDTGPVGAVVEPVDLLTVPGSTRLVLATGNHGVRISDDGGRSWSALNDGLAGLRTEDVAVDVVDGVARLALGTFARGAWTRVLDDLVSIGDEPRDDLAPPRVTRILPPAPNPFNPRTTIRWAQATDDDVTVELFDLRGRLLRKLLAARLIAGDHQVTWDGTDDQGSPVASGTYVARVRVGQRVHAARLTLIR